MRSFAIIGGGIVGLSVAYKLLIQDDKNKVVVYEKENFLGLHQSTRNSGVIHCGLSYAPGSLKAKLSYEGSKQLKTFCKENSIDIDNCGKIVVHDSIKVLEDLAKKGTVNGLKDLKILSKLEKSKSEIRRLIKGNAIKINNDIVTDEKFFLNEDLFKKKFVKLSIGKKRHLKIEIKN